MTVLQDFRIAFRAHCRRPSAFCTGVVVIGIALGGSAALLSIFDAALLRPPAHVQAPGEVVRVHLVRRGVVVESTGLSFPLYELIRDRVAALGGVAAYGARSIVIGRDEGARQVRVELVTGSYFSVLGVSPAVGRFFRPGEDGTRPASAMVVSFGLWQNAFGGSADVLGESVEVGDRRFTVVGVAPASFTGIDKARVDAWLPAASAEGLVGPGALSSPTLYWWRIFGRAPAGSKRAANAQVAVVAGAADWGPRGGDMALTLGPLQSEHGPGGARSPEGRLLSWVALSALLLLVMASVDVAAVLLVRVVASGRDLTTRAALGASRMRLVGGVACEAAIVAALGGLAGAGSAYLLTGMLQTVLVPGLDLAIADAGVRRMAESVGLAAIAGCIVALPAVLFVWKRYRRGQFGRSAHSGFERAAGTLVAAQCAGSVAVLIGAGLLGSSLRNVLDVDLGVDLEGLLYASAELRGDLPRADALALHESFAERIAEIPGVEGVSVAMGRPLHDGWGVAVALPGGTTRTTAEPVVALGRAVDEQYFQVTGARIARGRAFEPWEHESGARAVIVNEAFAREFWEMGGELGACLRLGNDPDCRSVVGVSENARRGLMLDQEFEIYIPIEREGGLGRKETLGLAIRAGMDRDGLIVPVRTTMEAASGVVAHATVMPVADILAPQLRPWRVGTGVLTAFGILAVILVGVGLYGLLAFVVARSRRAIGIRVALGATPAMVRRSIVLRGMGVSGIGIGGGLLAAVLAAPVGRSFVYGVEVRDPLVFAGSALAVLVTALAASWLPARLASRQDGAELLREG